MKIKQILIALAVIGANVLHNMPVHTALAAVDWYGTNTPTANTWTNNYLDTVAGGLTLTLDENTEVGGVSIDGVNNFYVGKNESQDVTNNTLTINSGTFLSGAIIYGGYSSSMPVSNNTIEVYNGTFNNNKIYGGYSLTNSESQANKVNIYGGTFNGDDTKIYGGFGINFCTGGSTEDKGNIVNIYGGEFANSGTVYGGYSSSGGAKYNKVNITGGTFSGSNKIYGGYTDGTGEADNNTVNISGGTFGSGFNIYGGYRSNTVADIPVAGNKVNITGGTFASGSIFGGYNLGYDAVDNIVEISGGSFADGIQLYGGSIGTGTSTGNTLNLKTAIGGKANYIQNFQNINFTIPTGATTDTVMLKMKNDPAYSMALSGITFTTDLNGLALTGDDYITLVSGVNGTVGALAGHTNFYILDVAGTKELVYANGTPTAKGDYTIKQGSDKFDSGATGGPYSVQINGNTTDGGLSDTSYSGNEIIIRRGTYSKVYGAYNNVNNTDTSNNTVNVYDGTFESELVGGCADYGGNADGNTVNFHGGKVTVGAGNVIVYGGAGTNATGNTVNIYDGNFEKTDSSTRIIRVYAGYGNNSASGNELNITGGSFNVADAVFAAGAGASGGVTDNVLNISGGNFMKPANFYGGFAEGGSAERNSVTIDEGTFSKAVFGGNGYTGAKDNEVTINDGTFTNLVYGGSSNNGPATGNKVTIDKGTFGSKIHGGSSNSGNAESNSVTINGGTFNNGIYAGYSNSSGAENNSVTINDGTFNEHVFGGYSEGSGNVIKNTVTILGGTFEGNGHYYAGGYSVSGDATDNTVNIERGTFTAGYKLYGGYSTATSSNNTLNLKIKMGGKAAEVGYFQTMNFTLPSNITKNDIMLSTANVTYDNTLIGVTAKTGVKLNKDEVIYLIKSENALIGTISNDGAYVLDGAAIVKLDGNNLILTLLQDFEQKEPEPPQSNEDKEKAPVEAISATAAMLNQSADLAMGEGLASLLENTNGNNNKNASATAENEAISNINTFGAVTANRSKYKTGSHVDMDGWGFLVGAGNTRNWKNGEKTTYGLFFEYGKGEFDTYNNDIHGEGDSNNKGVGIIARHTLNNNTYFDGAIRYGKQETEWNETEIGSYDTDSKYYGFSVGLGHIYPIGKNELDIYGRYTYGHTGSCDAKVGDKEYKFDSVKSSRLRVGTKLNIIIQGKQIKPYIGLAWEREMKGESKATITGMGEAPAPSLKGNTGIMQAGCSWEAGKWTLGAEANAYIGKRKGWGGMFNAFYNF